MAFPHNSHGFIFHQDSEYHHPSPVSFGSLPSGHLFHGCDQGLITAMMKRSTSFSRDPAEHGHHLHQQNHKISIVHHQDHEPDGDDLSDDGSLLGEKKKRLSVEQVRALERSFESGNKLDPERKMELAKALGLKPRQVAIWFQNRRARWKTKQLERDYESLKKQLESLKADNDALQAHNKLLIAQLQALRKKDSDESNAEKETQVLWSNDREEDRKSCDINQDLSRRHGGTSKNLFPHESARPDLHCLKVVQDQVGHEDSFCNMLINGIEEQHQGFWAWPDQQLNFH